jgi:hypothetical protein
VHSANSREHRPLQRATRWEVLGAWLHIWTPPRDVEVPPVPVRKLGVAALVLAAATAIGLALLIPAVERGKSRGEAQRAREDASATAAERARLAADQRVHRAVLPAGRDPIKALERVITADAQARDRAGTITGPVLGTHCRAAPPDSARYAASRVYSCFVSTGEGSDLRTGYPFVATIYADGPRAAWCKHNPAVDETSRRRLGAAISAECAGRLASVL